MCSKLKHFPVCAQPQHRSSRTTETSTCWSLPFHWPQSVLQQSMLGTPKLPACRANINAAQPQNSLHISGNWTRTICTNIWNYVCKFFFIFFNFSHFKVEKQCNYVYIIFFFFFFFTVSHHIKGTEKSCMWTCVGPYDFRDAENERVDHSQLF